LPLSLIVEAAILIFTGPLLYFPERVQGPVARLCQCDPTWTTLLAVGLLVLMWPLRRILLGRWAGPLPVSVGAALWFWFLVMLPVAVWAAPPPLREAYAWPRALILVWNFHLFWSVIAHAALERRILGWAMFGWLAVVQAIAMIAPFGMEPRAKLPVIGRIQEMIPRPLLGQFSGAEIGFSTNQLAGVLLYVLPLMIALCVAGLRRRGWQWWLLLLCTGWMSAAMVLSQSRGGLLGLLVALIVLALLWQRWGWIALAALTFACAVALFFLPPTWLDLFSDVPVVDAVGGISTVQNFRTTLWQAAFAALRDFFFTGMGLGTFRELVHLLYPLPGIPNNFDMAHAHHFFLQTGLDFGAPGLAAILVVYVAAIVQIVRMAHARRQTPIWAATPFITPRVLAIGWMGCMVGQTIYSLFDAVAMGSKPNFVWWWWMALIFAAATLILNQTTLHRDRLHADDTGEKA
jgi:O-antigen ligase